MSTSPQIVPLTTDPNQSFEVPLAIDGTVTSLYCALRYNEIAGFWVLTVSNAQGTLIIDSLPLLTGNDSAGNILGQFAYLGIGSAFVLNVSGVAAPDYPDDEDLGTDYQLLWDNTPSS